MKPTKLLVVPVLTMLAALLLVSPLPALAGRWAGHQTGGGAATVDPPPPPFAAVSPAPGTSISFGMVAKADSLVPAPPPGTLQAAPGATIQGHATWVDHSTSPPRTITLTTPLTFRCNPVTGSGNISGWGTDSTIPGPVFVLFLTFDGQAPAGPPGDLVGVRVFSAPPPPPPPGPLPLYFANATASGEVVQHSCTTPTPPALAAHWRGHQTGGGAATVLLPPPPFVAVSPALGTSISFGMVAKADSLVPAPPPGTLQAAPGATIQGHGTWIDHSTSPPRMIRLTTPTSFRCNPVTGQGAIFGLGIDSTIPGPVFVVFQTFDGDVPGGPGVDQVNVRVFLAPPVAPPAPIGIYFAIATVSGEVVQHSCQ